MSTKIKTANMKRASLRIAACVSTIIAGAMVCGCGAGKPPNVTNDTPTKDPRSCQEIDVKRPNLVGKMDAALNEWVRLEGGTYRRGYKKIHTLRFGQQVTVPSFKILKHEVTVAEFKACVDAEACVAAEGLTAASCNYNHPDKDRSDHPVNCITRDDAVSYCRAVGGRLPTASEWEYAARGQGEEISYPWGNGEHATCTFAVIGAGYGGGCEKEKTWPVCSKSRGNTAQGICDMYGSVLEFVADGYRTDDGRIPHDGHAIPYESGGPAVLRGGSSWKDLGDTDLYNVTPFYPTPVQGNLVIGIRCARDIESKTPTPFKDAPIVVKADEDSGPVKVLPIEWATIKGGRFHVGEAEDFSAGKPVTLSDFEIMKTEVTVAQYKQCKSCTSAERPIAGDPAYCNWDKDRRENHPINCVNWEMADAYCKSIGAKLPTEAQWEYVARNQGEKVRYAWGNDPYPSCDNAVVALVETRISGCGEERTFPVCSKPKGNTKQGVCDMQGNVSEWTADGMVETEHLPPGTTEPIEFYNIRGSSYYTGLISGSADNVTGQTILSIAAMPYIGFRCVR